MVHWRRPGSPGQIRSAHVPRNSKKTSGDSWPIPVPRTRCRRFKKPGGSSVFDARLTPGLDSRFSFNTARHDWPQGHADPKISTQDVTGWVTECVGLTNCCPGVTGCTLQCLSAAADRGGRPGGNLTTSPGRPDRAVPRPRPDQTGTCPVAPPATKPSHPVPWGGATTGSGDPAAPAAGCRPRPHPR